MAAQAERQRSTYVPSSQTSLVKFLENLHASALSYKQRWTRDWDRDGEIYRGNNWDTKKEGNPFFKTNLARAKLDKKAAKMVASKPIFDVLPRRSGVTNTAKILQRIVDALWDSLGIQMRLEQLSAFMRPFGCGFLKTVWDPRARQGLGDIVVAEIDPRAVCIDPYTLRAYDLERSLFIVHETSVPFSWVHDNFPRHADEVEDFNAPPPNQPDREATQGVRWSSRTIRSPLNYYLGGMRATGDPGRTTPIPYVRIREFWLADPETEDGKPLYPNGRALYLVGTGQKSTILNPEPETSRNPFWDGLWPFDMFDNRGDVDNPWGSSEVEDVRRLEEALNKTGHMVMRYMVKNVPFIVADAGALTPEMVKRLQDFGDVMVNKMRGLDVHRVPAQDPVGSGINWIKTIDGLMDSAIGLSGGSAVAGQGRVEVRSPDLLYGLQTDQNDIVNMQARRMEAGLERVGQKIISRIFQFYRSDRFIPYVTTQGHATFEFEVSKLREEIQSMAINSVAARIIAKQESEDDGSKTRRQTANIELVRTAIMQALRGAWREFDFKIMPLSSLSTTRAMRTKMMEQFAQVGAMPLSKVLEEAGFPNAKDLFEESAQERKLLMELGLVPPPQPPKKKK